MSEPAPEPQARGRVSRRTWLIALAVAGGAGVIWYLYRSRQSSQPAAAGTAAADVVDQAGELSVIQSELETLQAEEGQEGGGGWTGSGTPPITTPVNPPAGGGGGDHGGGGGGGVTVLAAPAGLSVTPHSRMADFGWGTVAGARVYELLVTGAGGRGTGTSHYDRTGAGNHARVSLQPGRYVARVRAGRSVTDVHGHWTAGKDFTVPR